MFSRTVRLKRRFSCSTTPTWRRSHAGVDHGKIDAVHQDASALGRMQTLHQFSERGLARA